MLTVILLQIQKRRQELTFSNATNLRDILGWHIVVHKKVPKERSYNIS